MVVYSIYPHTCLNSLCEQILKFLDFKSGGTQITSSYYALKS
jgi:hypothetical protein